MERIFKEIDSKTADLITTILASQKIQAVVKPRGRHSFDTWVEKRDLDQASYHLDLYARENPELTIPPKPAGSSFPTTFSHFLSPAILVVVSLLGLMHFWLVQNNLHNEMVFRLGASPYFLGQKETFRAVTALFLHADPGHLMGNMAGLVFMAGPLVRIMGPGTGLFCLLFAAVSANLLSNSLAMDTRLSIGASTAVMAAAGLLAAFQSLDRFSSGRKGRWLPLAAGTILMALFSHGERTDVSAHFFGFLCGAVTGLMVFPLKSTWHRPFMEPLFLGITLVIISTAFYMGLATL